MSVLSEIAKGAASGVSPVTALDDILAIGRDLIDHFLPDKEKDAERRAAAESRLLELTAANRAAVLAAQVQTDAQQATIDNTEAASSSFWKSGARPAVMWVCALALFEHFILWSYWSWISAINRWPIPPKLDMDELFPLLTAMLGVGAMRSFEKLKGVA